MNRKFINSLMVFFLMLGLTPNVLQTFANEIEVNKPSVNYEVKSLDENKNNISFILNENTSFNDSESSKDFDIKEIKDLDTNTSLTSLSYDVDKRDEYHFLVRYVNGLNDIENSFELTVNGINEVKEETVNQEVVVEENKEVKTNQEVSTYSTTIEGFDYETNTFVSDEARDAYVDAYLTHSQINSEKEMISGKNVVFPSGIMIVPNEYQNRKIEIESAKKYDPKKGNFIGSLLVGAIEYSSYWKYYYYGQNTSIKTIIFENGPNSVSVSDARFMFGFEVSSGETSLNNVINMRKLDLSGLTSLDRMFQYAYDLKSVDVSGLNVDNIKSMERMFYQCNDLIELNVSEWNTSQVTDMGYMFYRCSSLKTIDVSGWNTSQVTDMTGMFNGCSILTTLDVSNFNVSKVLYMEKMFSECYNLKTIDVSRWDTSSLMYASGMFYYCKSLESLDVSRWNTSNLRGIGASTSVVPPMEADRVKGMFEGCTSIKFLNISGWITSNIVNRHFVFNDMGRVIILVGDSNIKSYSLSNTNPVEVTFNGSNNYFKQVIYTVEEFEEINRLSNLEDYSMTLGSDLWKNSNDGIFLSEETREPVEIVMDSNGVVDYIDKATIKFICEEQEEEQIKKFGQEVNLNFVKERVGYSFEWNEMEDGTGQSYLLSDSIIVENNLTLYGIYTANNYLVSFNPGSGQGDVVNQEFTYDQTESLDSVTFTKPGYTQVGWSTTNGGAKKYELTQSVENLTTENNGVVNLYPYFEANDYTVTFKPNGGVGSEQQQAFVYDQSKNLNAVNFTKEGYTQVGWTRVEGGEKEYDLNQNVSNLVLEGNIDLYAVWEANTYTVTFKPNGGVGSEQQQAFIYDQSQRLNNVNFTKEGYTQVGWSRVENGEKEYDLNQNVSNLVLEGNIDLYAVWEVNTYTVTFKPNGGVGSEQQQSFIYDQSQRLNSVNFTKEGYTHVGWSRTEGGAKEYDLNQNVSNLVLEGNIDLYAVWEANTYEVIFNPNGAHNPNNGLVYTRQTLTYDVPEKLTYNVYTKGNAIFAGWSTEPNGEIKYLDGQEVLNLTTSGTIELYAQFRESSLSEYKWSFNHDKTAIILHQYIGKNNEVTVPNHFAEYPGYDVMISTQYGEDFNDTYGAFFKTGNVVSFEPGIKITTNNGIYKEPVNNLFFGVDELKNFENLSVEETINEISLYGMFNGTNLVEVDLSSFLTERCPLVTDMSLLFANSKVERIIGLENYKKGKLESIYGIFMGAFNLVDVNLPAFDVSTVKDFSKAFMLTNIPNLDLSAWNVSNGIWFNSMFQNVGNDSINLSDWNTSNVASYSMMFLDASNLTSLDLSSFTASNHIVDMNWMFSGCSNLESVNLENFDTSNTQFYYLRNGSNNPLYSNNDASYGGLFEGCSNLTNVNISKMSKYPTAESMFSGCSSMETIDISHIEFAKDNKVLQVYNKGNDREETEYSLIDTSIPMNYDVRNSAYYFFNSFSSTFSDCTSLTNIVGLENFKINNVVSFKSMFENCTSLTSLDLSNWSETKMVKSFEEMFKGCSNITSLNINNFNFGDGEFKFNNINNSNEVESFRRMFDGCSSISYIDISYWHIPTNLWPKTTGIFDNCNKLIVQVNEEKILPEGRNGLVIQGTIPHTLNFVVSPSEKNDYFTRVAYTTNDFNELMEPGKLKEYGDKLTAKYNIGQWINQRTHELLTTNTNAFDVIDDTYNGNVFSSAITFNPNSTGVEGIMDQQVIGNGIETKINKNYFKKFGYKFLGWSTTSNGNVEYQDEANITVTGDITLYAKWAPIEYTVRFNGNGASNPNAMEDLHLMFDQRVQLPLNKFVKYNSTFIGWSFVENPQVSDKFFVNGQEILNLTSQDGKIVNLYAVWKVGNEDGSIILPGKDDTLGTNDDITVHPGGDYEILPDGSIDLDNGAHVEYPNGGITLPPGTNIKPDGIVTFPNEDGVNGKVEVDPNGTIDGENGIRIPGYDMVLGDADDVLIIPDETGSASFNPDGSINLPHGGIGKYPNNGDIQIPTQSVVHPNGSITYPGNDLRPNTGDEVTILPDANGDIIIPGLDLVLESDKDGVKGDDVVIKPTENEFSIDEFGNVTLPQGGQLKFPGDIVIDAPVGSIVHPDGSVTYPQNDEMVGMETPTIFPSYTNEPNYDNVIVFPGVNGDLQSDKEGIKGDDVVVRPNGEQHIKPDGSVSLPNGGVVEYPNKEDLTVPNGSIVHPDGSVTFPVINDEVGGHLATINPDYNGGILIPGKDMELNTSTEQDDDVIVKPNGDYTFDDNGNINLPNGGSVIYPGGNRVDAPQHSIVLPDGTIKQKQYYSYQVNNEEIKTNGEVSGDDSDDGIPVNMIKISAENDAFYYAVSSDGIGWGEEISSSDSNSVGNGWNNIEALTLRLNEKYADEYDVYYRVRTKGFGWLGWAKNGEKSGSEGYQDYIQAIEVQVVKKGENAPANKDITIPYFNVQVEYRGHIQNKGWDSIVSNGEEAGTNGNALRIEAFQIRLKDKGYLEETDSDVLYQAHVQNIGWQDPVSGNSWIGNTTADGSFAGTEGKSYQIEAMGVKLTGEISKYFDVYYTTHVQNMGQLDWTKNGAYAGTARYQYRMESIRIKLIPKGLNGNGLSTLYPYIEQQSVWYKEHVKNHGWTNEVKDGEIPLEVVLSDGVEGYSVKLDKDNSYNGVIEYSSKIAGEEWSESTSTINTDGISGSIGENKQLEAIKLELKPSNSQRERDLSANFDIVYNVYVSGNYNGIERGGWLGDAKNGEYAGTEGYGATIKAIRIRLVPKILNHPSGGSFIKKEN